MKLIPNWKRVARKAWSARLMYVAAFMSGGESILPLFSDAFPKGLFAVITLVFVMGALVARFVLQEKLHE